ncbi:MAG: hypothetical protein AAGA69_12525 [Pseudomonadota bacterium]
MANSSDTTTNTSDPKRNLYEGMMSFGFAVGLPVGGAITMFIALLLMQVGIPVSFILSFFTWLGLYGIAKTFFVH